MLDRKYDPTQPYRIARYGRMSSRGQNRRSPDQQFNTIEETCARYGYPWQCMATARDDAISGRYLRKRPGLQRLLRDIESGLLQIDLLVVDSLERLGRADEIAELRRKLYVHYGILIVAADTGFSDPTGLVGKAVGMVEQIRSTEHTRILAHNVNRGKKDSARRRRWPGAKAPFGYRIRRDIDNSVDPPDIYSVLEHDPPQAAALALLFERADATGEGDLRLSQWWNANPDIPMEYKPISPPTIGYWISNPIAIGVLRWGKNRTGIVNDTHIIELNPDGAELIPDFCTPIVDVARFQRVQELRRCRAEGIRASRAQAQTCDNGGGKLIEPQSRGLTLVYLLTGLVRCGKCRASLRAMTSGRRSKAGKKYTYYMCPRHGDGSCLNSHHVPEDRLREAALARLRALLFADLGPGVSVPAWFPEWVEMLRGELQRLDSDEPGRTAAEQEELRHLEQQLTGWSITLGNPQLPAVVRHDIEAQYAGGRQRQQDLVQRAAVRQTLQTQLTQSLNPASVLEALHRLDETLAGTNPTLANLELSKHIDAIWCFPDGRVEVRGTMLGLFVRAAELLPRSGDGAAAPPHDGQYTPVLPRRRGALRVPNLSAQHHGLTDDVDTSLDPQRFAGLSESFFWTEALSIERVPSPAERIAADVARLRATGQTHEQLAAHFHVSVPTIRKALRIAQQAESGATSLPRRMPRARWPEQHFREVANLRRSGWSIQQLCEHFRRSEPLIRAALRLAEQDAESLPDRPLDRDPPPPTAPAA